MKVENKGKSVGRWGWEYTLKDKIANHFRLN